MNIVIPFINNHRNQNIELKYALRSLPEHDNVYIIGDNPELPNIIHIPFYNKPGLENKQLNIYLKILKAFEYMDEMIFCNDDHFLLPEFDINEYYYEGNLEDKLIPQTAHDYKMSVMNTMSFLNHWNRFTRYFDVHCPIIYEKTKFPVLDARSIKNWPDYGYCIKSLYCNWNNINGYYHKDLKIRKMLSEREIMYMLKDRKFFSTSDHVINRTLVSVLSSLYPQASRYEHASQVQA